ncbi:MAG: hypothetical protein LQ352_006717 [Teloschistes flavicans]|nr:MAG: hypothetical protein LQ352_006717 [Teloschistes flavicans]
MAAGGTRHQAELQGMNEHDIVSLGAPGGRIAEAMQRDNARRDFDQLPDCYPIFCLTENIPKTYWSQIQEHNTADQPVVEITSTDPDDQIMLGQCKLNFLDQDAIKPMPFVGWTIEACYDFFCQRISICGLKPGFTGFTFLAIDAACLTAAPQQEIIIGSDAGDYHEKPEDPPKLKVIRLPIHEAMESLAALECQSSSPSEIAHRTPFVASVMPPPIFAGVGDKARKYKREALSGIPAPWELKGGDEDKMEE